jgi:hypothetical protein
MEKTTTIKVSVSTRDRLKNTVGLSGDTYDTLINRALDAYNLCAVREMSAPVVTNSVSYSCSNSSDTASFYNTVRSMKKTYDTWSDK